jgi:toxin ParE1/3/4
VEATQCYTQQGGPERAECLFDAALAVLQPSERMPPMRSPRLGQLCDIPGLRC